MIKLLGVFAFALALPVLAAEAVAPRALQGLAKNLSDYLDREKVSSLKELRKGPALRKATISLMNDALIKIDKAPLNPEEIEKWDLTLKFPARQASADLWVGLCQQNYEILKHGLRARYDELRKKSKTVAPEEMFSAFSLSQSIVAAQFRKTFTELYAKQYPVTVLDTATGK